MSRVLVTGGAGLIGSHIADLLVRDGAEVLVLDDFSRGRPENLAWAKAHGTLRVIDGDLRDRATVTAAMAGIDLVFHQAAIRITQCAEQPRLALEVLVDGTFNVVEAAVAAGVRRIVAASSASIYGLASEFPTPETHPPWDDRTLYGASKLFSEGLLRSFRDTHGLDYVALRYFNVYGPRMDVHGVYTEVLVRWMERIAAGQPPIIFGDGTQTVDLVHVADVARANLLAAAAPVAGEVFNIGTGTETSLAALARTLARVMGSTLEPQHAAERSVNAVPRRLADVRKAARALGWSADVDLESGLASLVAWWRGTRTT